MLLREKYPDIEVTILYMDVRAYGKGYEEYFERAKEGGVRFLRGMPAGIQEEDGSLMIRVENTETGKMEELHPELVVLSVGLEPAQDSGALARKCGIPVGESGFYQSLQDKVDAVATVVPGIYIAGTAVSPRDIPDCVAQGQAAAMRAFLDTLRG
jgi:heterodisulfide reductase subunit A